MGKDELKTAVVRIYKQAGGIAGAGFLVDDRLVLTCAHVLDAALGRSFNTETKPTDSFLLDFPLLPSKTQLTANVPDWGWYPRQEDKSGDIAILSLIDSSQLLPETNPLPLIIVDDLLDHEFDTYGFPAGGREIGVSADGYIKRSTSIGWHHIEGKDSNGYRIQPGFSGAPVWDKELKSAVGIVVAADEGQKQARSAFMLPSCHIFEAFPQLRHSAPLSWIEVKNACDIVSKENLSHIRKNFDTSLYIERVDFQQRVINFLGSDKKYLAFVGPSGMGKSTFLAQIVNQLQTDDAYACLFFDAPSDLKAQDVSIREAILKNAARILDITAEDILKQIDNVPHHEHKLVLVIDAINEFDSMARVREILEEFRHFYLYPWLKIIISCRPHAWNYISSILGLARINENDFYRLDGSEEIYIPFGPMTLEEAPHFYQRYSQRYKLMPAVWAELNAPLRSRLREPLLLSLVAKICHDDNVNANTSLLVDVEAIPQYVATLFDEGALSETGADDELLFEKLPQLFIRDDFCFNYVPRKLIVNQYGRHTNASIERLIYTGILREDLRENLSFSFERFYGYYVGVHLRDRFSQGKKAFCQSG